MAMQSNEDIRFFTKGTNILLILVFVGLIVALYRLAVGLGPATNLSDNNPWGLWITFDVMTGVALAAGGFTITCAVYIFNWKKYKPITRAATLTAFLGYILVMLGLFLDIGKPFSFWHVWVFWQPHSVMFEIVVCLTLYSIVLLLEFLPWLLDRLHVAQRFSNGLKGSMVIYPLVIAGVVLSFGHQSSLGGLFLITPDKLHPLWASQQVHILFFLSAICAGLSMVSLESIISASFFQKGYERNILEGLGRGTAVALLVFFLARMADVGLRGAIPAIFQGGESQLFLLEMVVGTLVPMLLLCSRNIRESVSGLLVTHSLVLFGVIMYRFDTVFIAQGEMGGFYFPTLMEFAVTIGLVSLGIVLYKLAVKFLPIFSAPAESY